MIKNCNDNGVDISVPDYVAAKADAITRWEAECMYYPVKVVRKDSIKKAYDITIGWLNSGKTK